MAAAPLLCDPHNVTPRDLSWRLSVVGLFIMTVATGNQIGSPQGVPRVIESCH